MAGFSRGEVLRGSCKVADFRCGHESGFDLVFV